MANYFQNLRLALKDLKDGVCSIHVWPMLGWQEIRQRYRRSALGPFWLTISTGALIGGMGPLYGRLFGQDIASYFPYLAVGYIMWMLIASLINDSCTGFIAAEGYIKQVKLPLTVHILRVVWKNLIMFAHNLVIVVIVLLIYRQHWNWHLVLVPVGILLIAINGIWVGILLGALCARFRDIPQIVASVVQVLFFLTPVMWQSKMLGVHHWVADWNPLFLFLETVRAPLLGETPPSHTWSVVLLITIVGYVVTFAFFSRFRSRIAYWV